MSSPGRDPEQILKEWRGAQVRFVSQIATHPEIVKFDFQRDVLRQGAFDACLCIVNDPKGDRLALLYALGLLKRLTSKEAPKKIVHTEFTQETLERLVEELKPVSSKLLFLLLLLLFGGGDVCIGDCANSRLSSCYSHYYSSPVRFDRLFPLSLMKPIVHKILLCKKTHSHKMFAGN